MRTRSTPAQEPNNATHLSQNPTFIEVLLQIIQQLHNQVTELTRNQQRNQPNEQVDCDTEGSHHQHHQATHTPIPQPLTSLYSHNYFFLKFIMVVPLPNDIRLPNTLEPYYGITDP